MKTDWFHRGAKAWQRVTTRPDRGYLYVCPLCGRGFPLERIADLRREHAPSKAFGGKAICLTCKNCNHGAGSELDVEALRYEVGFDFPLGTMQKPVRATMTIEETSVAVEMHASGEGLRLVGIPKANDPRISEEMVRLLGEMTADPDRWKRASIKIEFSGGHARRAHLGVLRWAYIVSFALFGYRYVFDKRLKPIRDQLASPDQEIIPVFSVSDVNQARVERRVFLVKEPKWLQSIAVQIGRHVVFLPDPWIETTPYDEMLRQSRAGEELDAAIESSLHEWPTRPMHLLDFRPE